MAEKSVMDIPKVLDLIDQDPQYNYVKRALKLCDQSFDQFEMKNLFICFNGGKDAQAVLHLIRYVMYKRNRMQSGDSSNLFKGIKIVYFEDIEPFQEVEEFMIQHGKQFEFEYTRLCPDFKKGTKEMVEKEGMKAIFLGSRRADPWCAHQEYYSPSDVDKGWAPFIRINPIIDWTFEQTWKFLIDFGIPYCHLYDNGYTHLGNHKNTVINPYLQNEDGTFIPSNKANGKYEHFSRNGYNIREGLVKAEQVIIVYKSEPNLLLDYLKDIYPYISQDPLTITFVEVNKLNAFINKIQYDNDKTILAYDAKLNIEAEIKNAITKFEEFVTYEIKF